MNSCSTAENGKSNSHRTEVGLVSALRPWGIQSCRIKEPAYKFHCFTFQTQSQQEDREKRDKKAIRSDTDEQEKIVQIKAEM